MRRGVVIPVGRLKLIDGAAVAGRVRALLADAAAAKTTPPDGERRATWARILARVEGPLLGVDKHPVRAVRSATRRLFGAMKRLGHLKRSDDSPSPA